MKRNVLAVAAVVLTVASASDAQAQRAQRASVPAAARPVTFGLSLGASVPTGDMSKETDQTIAGASTGLNLTGMLGYRPVGMPLELRGELMYNRFGMKNIPDGMDANATVLGVTANALHTLSRGPVAPYVIGGLGYMQSKTSLSSEGVDFSVNKSGLALNGGAGIRLPLAGLSTFAEARYHVVFSKDEDKGLANATFIPVSFGIMF